MSEELEEKVVEDTGQLDAIGCPMYENHSVPMVLVSIGTERFIGGLLDLDEGICTIGYPLRYGEFVRPGSNGMADATVDMAMEKVYMHIGLMKDLRLCYATIYVLSPQNPEDIRVVESYQQNHERILKHDAGKIEVKDRNRIIIPGTEDVIRSNQVKVR